MKYTHIAATLIVTLASAAAGATPIETNRLSGPATVTAEVTVIGDNAAPTVRFIPASQTGLNAREMPERTQLGRIEIIHASAGVFCITTPTPPRIDTVDFVLSGTTDVIHTGMFPGMSVTGQPLMATSTVDSDACMPSAGASSPTYITLGSFTNSTYKPGTYTAVFNVYALGK